MFPISLNLEGQTCLVVGGGEVALRKVHGLLECGAVVRVVSPEVRPEILSLQAEGLVELQVRAFKKEDVEGCALVFAATNDAQINKEVYEACRDRRILVNVVDDPEHCLFIVPSTLRRGHLTISVCTEGCSPLLARRIRLQLEELFGAEYGMYVELLGMARSLVKELVKEEGRRRKIFEAIADIDVLGMIKQGKIDEAKERIRQCIYSWQE